MSDHKIIQTDAEAAMDRLCKRYPDKKVILEAMFPELVDRSTKIMIADTLGRSNTSHKYMVLWNKYEKYLFIANLSLGYTFKGKCHINYDPTGIPLRTNQLKQMVSSSINIDEFYIVENDKLKDDSFL